MFFTGFIQGGVSANTTAMFEQQAKHIAYIIAEAQNRGATTVEPSQDGQDAWVQHRQGTGDRQLGIRTVLHPWLLQQRGPRRRGRQRLVPRRLLLARLLRLRRAARRVARQGRPRWAWTLGHVSGRMADLRFDGRVAVVTGGGRGLGRSYALLLAAQGRQGRRQRSRRNPRPVTAPTPSPADQVVREIVAAGGEAVASTDSVATADGGQAIIDAALEHVRPHRHPDPQRRQRPAGARCAEMSYDDFDAVVDVHLRGAFHVVRPAFPVMCDAGYGRIVLTSSIGGLYGNHDVANYAVAKAGVIGLSNVAAMEGADARREEQRDRARRRDQDGRGHRHLGLPADGTRAGGARWSAGWRTKPVRSQARCSSRSPGRVAAAVVAETPGVYRPSWSIADVGEHIDGDPRRCRSRWSSRWCPTGTATTSGTASRWRAACG